MATQFSSASTQALEIPQRVSDQATASYQTKTQQIIPIDDLSPQLATNLCLLGSHAAYSLQSDPRFTYYLYAPEDYHALTGPLPLLVLIHSSSRNPGKLREQLEAFARERNAFLLCPLFPMGFLDANDTDNYKKIKFGDVRYDRVVLDMVDEASARFRKLDAAGFGLYGFSGGGQFVHRFAYLHPQRLRALVCGAPGQQTRMELEKDFPAGVRDLAEVFGSEDGDICANWASLKDVPSLFLCGMEDTDTAFATARGRLGDDILGMKGGRFEAAQRLERSWKENGARSRFVGVAGAAHQETKMLDDVMRFLDEVMFKESLESSQVTSKAAFVSSL